MVSTSVMDFLMEIGVLSFVFPVVILLTWRLRTKKSLIPALSGALFFLLFAKLLESIPFAIFVGWSNPVSEVIRSHEILYAVYQGVVAAIFEETGRYLAFRYFLPSYAENRQTAITYGIGHGGVECMIVVGWTSLVNYMGGAIINSGGTGAAQFPAETAKTLCSLTVLDCVLDAVSGVLFFALQLALSVMVFQAYRNRTICKRLLLIAMGLHFASYIPSGLYYSKWIPHSVSIILLFLVVLIAVLFAADIYKKMGIREKEREQERRKTAPTAEEKSWAFATKKLSNLEEEKSNDANKE